ncbi:MAG: hypothetical protein KGJ78_14390 [Alphaproteobacteria bacterium]|nr:hypothetical protein [Alphaproteobacteria bacterium]
MRIRGGGAMVGKIKAMAAQWAYCLVCTSIFMAAGAIRLPPCRSKRLRMLDLDAASWNSRAVGVRLSATNSRTGS